MVVLVGGRVSACRGRGDRQMTHVPGEIVDAIDPGAAPLEGRSGTGEHPEATTPVGSQSESYNEPADSFVACRRDPSRFVAPPFGEAVKKPGRSGYVAY